MTPTSLADFSLHAASRYLQSAVFIDDNIYNQGTAGLEAVVDVSVRQPKAVIQEESRPIPAEHKDASPQKQEIIPPFKTKDLVGSFAEHGIVCALYEPERNFSTNENSIVFRLCQTADLVILDWDFHEVGVQGAKPKALIENLIKSSNRIAPHHVRLIAIYTNTPSLQSIANSIFQHFGTVGVNVEPVDGCAFRLQAGSSRVIILGKAGGAPRVESEKTFSVAEVDLAARIIREFASMNQGILPSCALLGMAAVRRNSRRILDKFRAGLDGQFLLHRALIRSSEEGFEQLPELLGDEFRAVVEDAEYYPDDPTKFVSVSSNEIPLNAHPQPWVVGGVDCKDALRDFWVQDNALSRLLAGKKPPKEDGSQPTKPVESLASMCSVDDNTAHERFAALLGIRTQYQSKHRTLGFGTIICDRTNKQYSVCIIPPCDSLRLRGQTQFPFWRLGTTGKGNPIIVNRDGGEVLRLVFESGKPSTFMWMAPFTPDLTKRTVIAVKTEADTHIFKSGEIEFEWVAQLKPSHAQRVANSIGQQLSRVGLTEAEWARVAYGAQS
jgi:hypothetical protein